jgi:hypothetical protein
MYTRYSVLTCPCSFMSCIISHAQNSVNTSQTVFSVVKTVQWPQDQIPGHRFKGSYKWCFHASSTKQKGTPKRSLRGSGLMASVDPVVLRWVDGPVLEFRFQLDLPRSTTKETRSARLFGSTFGNILHNIKLRKMSSEAFACLA